MLKEFREFAMKGSVVDLAVGLIIGTAFGAIVKSLVDDIIMPPIGLILGNVDFSQLKYIMQPASHRRRRQGDRRSRDPLRRFLNIIITFIIVAFSMFMIVKAMNSMKRKQEAAPAPTPETPPQEKLLAEIRDLLAKRP